MRSWSLVQRMNQFFMGGFELYAPSDPGQCLLDPVRCRFRRFHHFNVHPLSSQFWGKISLGEHQVQPLTHPKRKAPIPSM
ncbi:hypothetical protein VTN31DRAFT_1518 [Thermomyces dupontii]|uniref:uncharacterized protein n=1 Tax=Talaromyces thermophilus TaxID=28565 RepID=UPI003742404D